MEILEKIHRRKFLSNSSRLAAGLSTSAAVSGWSLAAQTSDRIKAENQKPGTLEWQLQFTEFDDPPALASYPLVRRLRSSAIEGYVSRTSLTPGETLDLMVSMEPEGRFVVDVYRMGYYGGTGGRHMLHLGPFSASPQPVPMMTVERLRECRWPVSAQLRIPEDWPSGVYLGKLSRQETFGPQSYVIFVVKEHRPSDLLYQVSDLTWQAYNKWPGNDSLYDDGTPKVWYTGPNVRVSFDRPYAKYCQILDAPLSAGSGEFLLWEHPMVFWLEAQGYDVTYCSNLDLHLDPAILAAKKAFLSVGHDEYWSRQMFEEVKKARNDGLSLAFFSGNSVYSQIIFYDASESGAPCRAFAREQRFQDEHELMGTTSYGSGYGDWIVTRPDHWIYQGTGLERDQRIKGVIGWEYHGPPCTEREGLEILAEGPITPAGSDKRHAAVIYPGPHGNWVFNAGTIWWPEGLSQPPGHIPARHGPRAGTLGVQPVIQKITANLLDRMILDSKRS